jgi:hypothetical protein
MWVVVSMIVSALVMISGLASPGSRTLMITWSPTSGRTSMLREWRAVGEDTR